MICLMRGNQLSLKYTFETGKITGELNGIIFHALKLKLPGEDDGASTVISPVIHG